MGYVSNYSGSPDRIEMTQNMFRRSNYA